MTTTLVEAGDGTNVVVVHEGIPPGVPIADNEMGTGLSLDNLAPCGVELTAPLEPCRRLPGPPRPRDRPVLTQARALGHPLTAAVPKPAADSQQLPAPKRAARRSAPPGREHVARQERTVLPMCEQFGGLGSAACRSVTVSGLLCISDLPTELFQSTAQKPCGRPSGVRLLRFSECLRARLFTSLHGEGPLALNATVPPRPIYILSYVHFHCTCARTCTLTVHTSLLCPADLRMCISS